MSSIYVRNNNTGVAGDLERYNKGKSLQVSRDNMDCQNFMTCNFMGYSAGGGGGGGFWNIPLNFPPSKTLV